MNYIQAMKLLDNGELNGIYVLSGEEIFLSYLKRILFQKIFLIWIISNMIFQKLTYKS